MLANEVSGERVALLRAALGSVQNGEFTAAEASCRALLQVGRDIDAELLLGLALGGQGRLQQAMGLLDGVALARPSHAHPCRDLAELLAGLGQAEAAIAQYRNWLDRAPGDASAHHAVGLLLAGLGEFEQAASHFHRAVTIDPGPAMGWSNLGMMLKIAGRFDEAIAAHDQAVVRAPNDAQIRVNRAVALLHAGRLTEAWGDYEWRLRQPGRAQLSLAKLLPDVAGVALEGRRVLVMHEEGFGDTLQFIRYVPLLAERGARVVLAGPPELLRIAATVDGVGELHCTPVAADIADGCDFHCPVFSLPRAFGTTMERIPRVVPYLRADTARVAAWVRRLPRGMPRIGLVWAGQARPWLPGFDALDQRRSAGLATFAPLAEVSDVAFVSLQKGPAGVEARHPPSGMVLHDPMPEVEDFADTAAVIANLDLVVSVDTAVVHLAGALGKPVFLLDRYDNCWRWFSGRTDSPWYPGLRIFRQERPGVWEEPMRRVVEGVRALSRVGFRGVDLSRER